MWNIKNNVYVAILAWCISGNGFAEIVETVTLRHQLADQVVPVLQGAFPQARIQAFHGTLIIAAPDEASYAQILALLQRLDTPMQNLVVTVEQRSLQKGSNVGVSTQGGIAVSNRGVGFGITLRGQDRQSQSTGLSRQTLRILEGAEGRIHLGQQRFVPQISFWFRPGFTITHVGGQWQSAGTGFYVAPRRIGENDIALRLLPSQREFTRGGGTQGHEIYSEVQGRIGEWLPVGETQQMQSSQERGLLSGLNGNQTQSFSVWVKVDVPN
ncbi:hypothetical protein [Deefgea rivuli]|uniref:hypothetical protein n=1 Tax=Deefgea rivuli TaxID=400948 RepID=UPI000487E04A|nr:hypothetical protein [Deefgea rivuli]